MSHLDTAFKIGAAQAQHDFQAELDKVATGEIEMAGKAKAPPPPPPPQPPMRQPGGAVLPPIDKNIGGQKFPK